MDMYIDFKITTWERINVPKVLESKVKELIEKGNIKCGDDLYCHFADHDIKDYNLLSSETLLDCSEQMTVEENDGESTIEAYINNKLIYENGK